MGKHKNRKRKHKSDEASKRGWRQDENGQNVVIRKNDLFEKFYKAQGIVPEDEWSLFLETLKEDLPISFRFVGSKRESEFLLHILKDRYLSKIVDVEIDGKKIEPAQELEWYPKGMAFQLSVPRRVLRKHNLLNNLHNFLVTESDLGNVSRQETVSMIPPLLLEINSESRIFDMCAAPGSKTAQLIEMLHGDDESKVPNGFVLANDENNKRCYLLVHQSLKRLNSPCCLVVNCDAACIPYPRILKDDDTIESVKFDQILCDVPCSGDGTMRKNLEIWRTWSPYHGYNLHRLQIRIAKRGLEMLQVGGLMVYSTCSFNPAENEASVANLLQFSKGSVELVDVSSKLLGLKRSQGLKTWKIMDKEGQFYETFEQVPVDKRRYFPETIFPPTPEMAESMHLERCMRLLPHQQNTGGFFVALLRKTTEFPWIKPNAFVKKINICTLNLLSGSTTEADVDDDQPKQEESSCPLSPPRKQRRFQGYKEDPFVFLTSKDESWAAVERYFGIVDGFPIGQLLRRGREAHKKRNLYFVNDIIKRIIENNNDSIKIINAGTRIFNRIDVKESNSQIRLTQDGINILLPYLRKRLINISRDDLIDALTKSTNNCYPINMFSEETKRQFELWDEGSVVLICKIEDRHVAVCAWKLKTQVAPFLSKESAIHVLRLLHYDTTEMENEMLNSKRKRNAEKSAVGEGKQPSESNYTSDKEDISISIDSTENVVE